MIPVKEIDKDLSLKLGDPRLDNGDGEIWDLADRLGYISRAYGRLCRQLQSLMIERQPLWVKKMKHKEMSLKTSGAVSTGGGIDSSGDTANFDYTSGKDVDIQEGFEKINQLYVIGKIPGKFVKAEWIDPDKFLDVTIKGDSAYPLDYDKSQIRYTVINNKLQILPYKTNGYSKISVVFKGEPEVFNLADSVDITTNYLDLLILNAAKEGMEDLARGDKVNLYNGDIINELKLIGIFIEKEERDEGIHT